MNAAALSAGQRHRLIRAQERPDGLVLVRGKGPVQFKLRATGLTAAYGDGVDVCTPLGLEVRAVCLEDPFLSRERSADARHREAQLTREGLMGGVQKPWTAEEEARLREMVAANAKRPAIAAALGRTQGSVIARAKKLGCKPSGGSN